VIDDMLPRILFKRWEPLPGWEPAGGLDKLAYEFGLAGRQLVEDTSKFVTMPDGTRIDSFPYIWGARLEMIALYILMIVLVAIAWRRRGRRGPEGAEA
jgi:hypothetical protein